MGKKTKTGKGRLDKFYQLAKDQGYRARSAFKLIQLAKKNDFLSKANVCLDLCAAPGGWSQVAQRNMPKGSLIVAIDLCPIKPIHGVTCMMADITTDKCRSMLKKELLGKRADVVLHDGAPNVGSTWAKDAYGQNELTLHSLKLACEHLRAGGTFVTKVFRSADYNSLMWVFQQLFNKVEATKPTASRNVSAEIFVLCLGFKAGKIDPRFFDPRWVFMESLDPLANADTNQAGKPITSLNEYLKNQKKKHRSGYEEGDLLKIVPANDFFSSENPAEVLITHHRISLDAPGSESIRDHAGTTLEVRELCADLKVLGKHDLTTLLKWRMKILREREKAERATRKAAAAAAAAAAKGAKSAAKAAKAAGDAAGAVKQDVDAAIDEMLDDAPGGKSKDDEDEDSAAEGEAEEQLEQELAEQVEKRRKEERREGKKTMERQKKQEWRKKMSLISSKNSLGDQPELFKIGKRSIHALENQDDYIDPATLDSGAEGSCSDSGGEASESDSDAEGLDRMARMEVDVAVDMQLRKMRHEDKYRTQLQRIKKKKKETRRQRVMAAWAGELTEFNAAIQGKAANEMALQDKGSDDEDDDDDDSDGDLKTLRTLQDTGADEGKGSGLDGEALAALIDGGRASEDEDDEDDDDEEDKAGDGEGAKGDGEDGADAAAAAGKKKQKGLKALTAGASSTAIVPRKEPDEEDVKAEHRMARWFSQDIFKSAGKGKMMPLDRDSSDSGSDVGESRMRELDDSKLPRMPLTDKQKRSLKRKKDEERNEKRGKKQKGDKEKDEDQGPMEVAPLEPPRPLVPVKEGPTKPSDPQELAETLALGSLLVDSKKSRMDIIDAAYNRYSFEEDPLLPDWFTEEETKFHKAELPVSKELMTQFRAKLREINARPIRKVAEARARKKRRLNKRLEKLRSTAMSLVDTPDMSEAMKAKQMRKEMRKLAKQDERKVTVVAMKKGGGGKRMNKGKVPKGAKVKVVDRRVKSDRRGEKKAAKRNKSKHKAEARKQSIKKQNKKGGRRGAK